MFAAFLHAMCLPRVLILLARGPEKWELGKSCSQTSFQIPHWSGAERGWAALRPELKRDCSQSLPDLLPLNCHVSDAQSSTFWVTVSSTLLQDGNLSRMCEEPSPFSRPASSLLACVLGVPFISTSPSLARQASSFGRRANGSCAQFLPQKW